MIAGGFERLRNRGADAARSTRDDRDACHGFPPFDYRWCRLLLLAGEGTRSAE
jgi:hypothetical protein